MNRVYGIGLPRTGTTSLAEALKRLSGKETKHHCVLHDNDHFIYDNEDIVAYIDNSFYGKYKKIIKEILLNKHKDSLFILTTRNHDDWEKSMSRFTKSEDLPDVETYEKLIKAVFKCIGKEDKLLVINIFEDTKSIEKLCDFIGVEYQDVPFPHIKKEDEIEIGTILPQLIWGGVKGSC